MADRVYPSAKPNPQPPVSTGGVAPPPSFPATKSQMYQRPMYRPPAPSKSRRRRSGGSCRCFCLWIVIVIILLVLLAAIAGAIFYVLYRPHRPTFTVSSVRLSTFNLSASSNLLTSSLDLSITARNPNKKLVFLYDDFSVGFTSNGADVGDGSIPGFRHEAKNTTVLKATAGVSKQSVDPSSVSDLKKSNVPLAVDLETKAGVMVGSLKTKKVAIKVHCEGFQAAAPVKGKAGVAATPDTVCQVKLRFKIWKWSF